MVQCHSQPLHAQACGSSQHAVCFAADQEFGGAFLHISITLKYEEPQKKKATKASLRAL
jgi:hypothetical protein